MECVIYFVERYEKEFKSTDSRYYQHGDFAKELYENGSVYSQECTDGQIMLITADYGKAKRFLMNHKTYMQKIQNSGIQCLNIKEYGLIQKKYDLKEITGDYPNIETREQLISRLKETPADFAEYEISNETYPLDFSEREFVGTVVTDDGTYEMTFDDYGDAQEWLDEMYDEKEDEGIINAAIRFMV